MKGVSAAAIIEKPMLLDVMVSGSMEGWSSIPEMQGMSRLVILLNGITPETAADVAAQTLELIRKSSSKRSDAHAWMAMHVTRARILPSARQHQLLMKWLNLMDCPRLTQCFLNFSYAYLNKLLPLAGQLQAVPIYGSYLRSVGGWIGLMTFGQGQCVQTSRLDVEKVLHKAIRGGHLSVVLPLVCRLLQGVVRPDEEPAPRPPSLYGKRPGSWDVCREDAPAYAEPLDPNTPYFLSALALLVKVSKTERLRFRLICELSQFFKVMGVATEAFPEELDPGEIELQPADMEAQADAAVDKTDEITDLQLQLLSSSKPRWAASAAGQWLESSYEQLASLFSQLGGKVKAEGRCRTAMLIALPAAIERTVSQLIQGILDRNVSVSCIATRIVCLKDFCYEKDVNLLAAASKTMSLFLSSKLALVNSVEQLRGAFYKNLAHLLKTCFDMEPEKLTQVISDNLVLVLDIVECFVKEYACTRIDQLLEPHYKQRELQQREARDEPFFDPAFQPIYGRARKGAKPSLLDTLAIPLPDNLRPRDQLSSKQLFVYKSFFAKHPKDQLFQR